jgi:probable rRNA maturation factor
MLDNVLEDARWSDLERWAQRAIPAALEHLGLDPDRCEVTILGCDDARIAALNADFRGKPTPTNVLSWPAADRAAPTPGGNPQAAVPGLDGIIELGDIAISFDTCAAEAQAAGKPLIAHTTHLVVHGLLHLLGYDHQDDAGAGLMERKEIEILGKLGQDDPYRNDGAA